ncbi:uncharacterized protein LOC135687342 isoform X1 [Rhopilema esculentum]|uniref:uncharacterized protein LOC135687342 isoform X1 n=1 Tax=Rhopilema esculentum TaxID=499914 RepID=UPI0031D1AFE6|eukprot:gene6318-11745_t
MAYIVASSFMTSPSEVRALARNVRVDSELKQYSACLDKQKEYQRRILDLNIRVMRNNFSRSKTALRRCKTAVGVCDSRCLEKERKSILPFSPLPNATNSARVKKDPLGRIGVSAPFRCRSHTYSPNSSRYTINKRETDCDGQMSAISTTVSRFENQKHRKNSTGLKLAEVERKVSSGSIGLPNLSMISENSRAESTTVNRNESRTSLVSKFSSAKLASKATAKEEDEKCNRQKDVSSYRQKLKLTKSAPTHTQSSTAKPAETDSLASPNEQPKGNSMENSEIDRPDSIMSCSKRSKSPLTTAVRFEEEIATNQQPNERARERQRSKSLPATEMLHDFQFQRAFVNDSDTIAKYIAKQDPIFNGNRDTLEEKGVDALETDSNVDVSDENLEDCKPDCEDPEDANEDLDEGANTTNENGEIESNDNILCTLEVKDDNISAVKNETNDSCHESTERKLGALPFLPRRSSSLTRQRAKSAFCTTETIWETIELCRLIEKHGGNPDWQELPVYGPEVKPIEFEMEEIKRCRYIRLPKYIEMENEFREISCVFS